MTFRFERWKMAQALSLVAEQGIHGFEYNAIVEKLSRQPVRQSKRKRLSLFPAHQFHPDEFEEYMILAWRFRYVDRSKFAESEMTHGLNKSSYEIEDEIVLLTQSGWEYVETYDQPLLHRLWMKFIDAWPSAIVSIIVAFVTSWLLLVYGAPN